MGLHMNKKRKHFKRILSAAMLLILVSFNMSAGLAAFEGKQLIPLGNTVGINLQSEGVMIVGVPDILNDGQSASPARSAGLTAGDIITQIGTQHISTTDDLKAAIGKLDGSAVSIKVMRGTGVVELNVTPHKAADGHCELGLWMRDGIAGIGTMTFYDPETGAFGALGHSVNDMETGIIIPLRTGTIMRSYVTDVAHGKVGMPGQLRGTFNMENTIGKLTKNTASGIFGFLDKEDLIFGKKAMPVAPVSEIKTGPAKILSNVSGTDVTAYDVEITRVYTGDEAIGRSMMLSVKDPRLIEQTGGIVQGMSGSPIIQDGKIIGAVTHVLINDPTRGYGISIENMLTTINSETPKKAA